MRLYALLMLLCLLAACAPAAKQAAKPPAQPQQVVKPLVFELLPGNTSLGKFNPPGAGAVIDLTIGAKVRNPNDFPVALKEVSYQLLFGKLLAAKGQFAQKVSLEPGKSALISFDVRVDLKDKPDLVRQVAAAFTGQTLPFSLEGTVQLATLGYTPSYGPAVLLAGETHAREVWAPPQLTYEQKQSEVFLLEPGVPVVRVVAQATNPGAIGYFLYGNNLLLKLAGQPLAYADLSPVPIPAHSGSRLEILFYPDVNRLDDATAQALKAALAGIPMSLDISGELKLDVLGVATFKVPAEWKLAGFVEAKKP
jgi:hypothetical protein